MPRSQAAPVRERARWTARNDYSSAEPWAPHVVVDRNLYSGQNPASSAPLAETVIKAIG
ncbi:hypothetical protein ACWDU9_06050 [Streptomyces cellulosae]